MGVRGSGEDWDGDCTPIDLISVEKKVEDYTLDQP